MRLWSLHPNYLDAQGLVALWREGLLARTVLLGETKGYRNHPQLARFRALNDPLAAIDIYLGAVCDEADRRGYRFDRTKILPREEVIPLVPVTTGQLGYEWQHLLRKLERRDPARFETFRGMPEPEPHPLFQVIAGGIEVWEAVPEQRA